MALKSNFDSGRVQRETQVQAETLYKTILDSFIRAGEEFVTNAREQMSDHAMGQYEDVTANLRNSISYSVFYNGELVIGKAPGTFTGKKNEGKLGTSEIASINESAIKDLIKPKGFQLIGIAGMNYASHVESKGYNVISYQADVCMIDLAVYLEKLEVIEQGTAARMEESFIP